MNQKDLPKTERFSQTEHPQARKAELSTPSSLNQLLLPASGYVRLPSILGDPKANPPIPGLFPVSKSTWWNGVREGVYPAPVKLSARVTAWRVEDIMALINKVGQ